ncbi:biotin/lipoyl-containing protein [Amycolatopsis alkalitolerans]|uniref:Dihydrolipoamide acetyltransferase component of pyruvate dehydrogenase complex n=1 Tax=Amycolatopsis alkalitolerans TaxID=2547244 RepID=A0A5C4M896_9PSEU|nr:biotin/lipoyl-containing protein [Amycolatopsis alkalitolerans]TNC29215.1 hypothetical protein FG385_03830 [Amycolatopsis alkalitolerans]
MSVQVQMPALGESVTQGTILQWLKKEGDLVEEGEPLLEVATDKVDTEIPSPVTGVIEKIIAGQDETVAVGGDLAVVAEGACAVEQAAPPPQPTRPAAGNSGTVVLATPEVRALAREHGIALHMLRGGGPGGRIRKQDVLAAAGAEPWQPGPLSKPAHAPRAVPTGVRQAPAARQTVTGAGQPPPAPTSVAGSVIILQQEVDVTRLVSLRDRFGPGFAARESVDLTILAFLAQAVVDAVRKVPALAPAASGPINLGIATDGHTDGVVVEYADRLNVAGLARAAATGSGATTTAAATFSIAAVEGDAGVLVDTPALREDQTASLGMGAVVKRPRIVEGPRGEDTITISSVSTISLIAHARRVDRHAAGRFLTVVRKRLEEAQFEADLKP